MPRRSEEEYELLARRSSDSTQDSDSDRGYDVSLPKHPQFLRLSAWSVPAWFRRRSISIPFWAGQSKVSLPSKQRRWCYRLCCVAPAALVCGTIILIVFTALFLPSYTYPPAHYKELQKRCSMSLEPGRGNVNNEMIFIAAALYDAGGELLNGAWGHSVLGLVDLLGPDNVYLSIYENDADPAAIAALASFKTKVKCNSTIISEHLPLEDIPRFTMPTGEKRTKRIAFLAEVRNRALRPLAAEGAGRFNKLLYINDVMFKPVDAVNLLFSTNVDASGRSQYGAVCAVDFINAFKFYDRFATRDFEGYDMGIPFYPWFTDAGGGSSRQDVLDQKDAVRVRACWGGMTAFEAKWFVESQDLAPINGRDGVQSGVADSLSPLRFRYEKDPFWDASECCLIHADLTYLRHGRNTTTKSGIFTNPYIRVAYDSQTLSWLALTRRTERLYSLVHNVLNHLVGLPYHNPRRMEQPGDEVVEKVWVWDQEREEGTGRVAGSMPHGQYLDVKRIATPGRFCGGRHLLVLNDDPKPGEKKWMSVPLPALPG